MKTRTNIILLVVLLALCVGYWLLVRGLFERKQQAIEAKRLYSFASADVTAITILREGERATTGVRDAAKSGWRVTQPTGIVANAQVWERVATSIAELRNEQTIDEEASNPADFGLDEPVLEVTAQTASGDGIAVAFGMMDPTQKFRYAREGDGPIFLAHPDQFFLLDRNLEWLRDRNLFKVGDAGITRIEFTPMRAAKSAPEKGAAAVEESTTVIAEKNAQGVWSIVAPQPGTADQQMLNTLASELQFAMGRDYIENPENLTDYQLAPPRARVSIQSGADGPLQTAYFGTFERERKEDAGVFVMQEGMPAVFVVDASIVTNFPLSSPDAWREKRLITRQGGDITSLKYAAGPQQFLLSNDETQGWILKEPREEPTDQAAVSRFIGDLLEMKGSQSFTERKPEFGLDVPAIRMMLTFRGANEPVEILVGAATADESRYYVTQDSGTVITLPQKDVDALAVSMKKFMSRGLLSFQKNTATNVVLTLDNTRHVFARGEQQWKITEPADKVWESQDDMQTILDTFASFSAESVDAAEAPADLSPFGLDKPALTVQVAALPDGAAEPVTLPVVIIGSACPDDAHLRYAQVEGRPQIYRVKQAAVSEVRDALRGVVDQ
ncbi:MAG: DUF4340 domain-containing protein [Candidatus Hydrogenedentes bacterium]|nr:DUF4340 domain-containing protein [Candidatus Hydrogenedentota bacterium]